MMRSQSESIVEENTKTKSRFYVIFQKGMFNRSSSKLKCANAGELLGSD
jgi:hypothetical protein